jgi:hypothetical protein
VGCEVFDLYMLDAARRRGDFSKHFIKWLGERSKYGSDTKSVNKAWT